MKKIKMIKKLLKDPLHWMGWGLTTFSVIGILYLFNVFELIIDFYIVISLFLTIVIIDIFKHITNLQ